MGARARACGRDADRGRAPCRCRLPRRGVAHRAPRVPRPSAGPVESCRPRGLDSDGAARRPDARPAACGVPPGPVAVPARARRPARQRAVRRRCGSDGHRLGAVLAARRLGRRRRGGRRGVLARRAARSSRPRSARASTSGASSSSGRSRSASRRCTCSVRGTRRPSATTLRSSTRSCDRREARRRSSPATRVVRVGGLEARCGSVPPLATGGGRPGGAPCDGPARRVARWAAHSHAAGRSRPSRLRVRRRGS